MATMQQEQPEAQPLYWDNHRVSVNLTLILALAVAVVGLFSGSLLFFAGVGVAAYTWFTSPRRYLIYENALVIEYGRPRVKVIDFANISHVEMLSLGIGERLRVVMINGKRAMVMARNLDAFRERLDEALERYQSQNPQDQNFQSQPARELNADIDPEPDSRGRVIDVDQGSDHEGSQDR